MATVQWRPEVNALTTPQSWRPRYVARNTNGSDVLAEEKLPVIANAEDMVLGLSDVLNPGGALRLSGSDLAFTLGAADEGCVLEGTRSGRTVQSRFLSVSDTAITLLPDIPAQNEPWNNEYLLSIATRYTENGTLRTGTYRRRLRSVLAINGLTHPEGLGILSSNETDQAYVTLTSGSTSASEMLRIQAVFNTRDSVLLMNLISIKEDGPVGEVVLISANGSMTLQGFTESAVSYITINVVDYLALTALVRDYYYNRLVDVLDVKIS